LLSVLSLPNRLARRYTVGMDHDHSYKLLFSHPEMVADLLRGFVREDWVEELDFATLDRFHDGHVGDDLREREDDIVWRLRFRGTWLYVYTQNRHKLNIQSPLSLRERVRVRAFKKFNLWRHKVYLLLEFQS
jgi:predicted transposase YdaD